MQEDPLPSGSQLCENEALLGLMGCFLNKHIDFFFLFSFSQS